MPIRLEERHRYPPDWPAISAAIRKGRAGNRCECIGECGQDHGFALGGEPARCPRRHRDPCPSNPSHPTILTVAHLDHTPENCDPSNLKAMCQACHLRYDARHHAESRAHRPEEPR